MTITLPDVSRRALGNRDRIVCETGERHGFSQKLWDRLVARITKNLEFQQEFGTETADVQRMWAEVLLDQALGFMWLCGTKPAGGPYAPSALVDIAWETFVLYTKEYEKFCLQNFGRFLHHAPNDEPGAAAPAANSGINYVARTVEGMKAAGISVIDAAWPGAPICYLGGGKCGSGGGDGDGGDGGGN